MTHVGSGSDDRATGVGGWHRRASTFPGFVALLLLALAGPVAGQDTRFVAGLGGGWAWYGDLTPGLAYETEFEPGWLAAGQLELALLRGRIGLRLDGTYTRARLRDGGGLEYGAATGDLAVLVRPFRLGDRPFLRPHLVLGAGLSRYAAVDHDQPLGQGAFGDDPVTRFGVIAGLGVDLWPARAVGLRLEAADRAVFPSVGQSPPTADDAPIPLTHNPRVIALLQFRTGARPRTVATRPAPAAPTPAEPAQPAEAPGRDVAERAPPTEPADTAAAVSPDPFPVPPPIEAAAFTVEVENLLELSTAATWAERARGLGLPAWVHDTRVAGQSFGRLRIGVVDAESDAGALVRLVASRLGWTARVTPLPDPSEAPADAAAMTAAVLERESDS